MSKTASMASRTIALSWTSATGAAMLAALIGLAILYVIGFAQPDALHNGAHDSRHALAFPCH